MQTTDLQLRARLYFAMFALAGVNLLQTIGW